MRVLAVVSFLIGVSALVVASGLPYWTLPLCLSAALTMLALQQTPFLRGLQANRNDEMNNVSAMRVAHEAFRPFMFQDRPGQRPGSFAEENSYPVLGPCAM
jgi:hypothetical protein